MEQKSLTREEYKKELSGEKQPEQKRKIRIRLIPIWLRIIMIALLIVISAAIGLVVGYSVFGDGKALDVFKKDTWVHIVDLVKKES
ncbi:DNA-directed RNA polymerase subunit beta [Peribacillus tepidiphilus]|uniref:DNA-directed RNA polymerase subunit beta n=1 Tax=Peribacillus tepidiphilus TaxID=2652445 RepID=UPI001290F3C7|nr:DNA-directed RNA polymerase subunit beta [Peribacillus tepidiphilus]